MKREEKLKRILKTILIGQGIMFFGLIMAVISAHLLYTFDGYKAIEFASIMFCVCSLATSFVVGIVYILTGI